MRQAQSARVQAGRARRLSENLSTDQQARAALAAYADELDRGADALERAAQEPREADLPAPVPTSPADADDLK